MRRNKSLPAEMLTANQEQALAALLTGSSVTDAAAAAAVDRTTVHRWLKDDVQFRAAHNRGRRELCQATEGRLLTLATKAMKCVETALDSGDGKVALALLKDLGLLPGVLPSIGSDDPAILAENDKEQERVRKEKREDRAEQAAERKLARSQRELARSQREKDQKHEAELQKLF